MKFLNDGQMMGLLIILCSVMGFLAGKYDSNSHSNENNKEGE